MILRNSIINKVVVTMDSHRIMRTGFTKAVYCIGERQCTMEKEETRVFLATDVIQQRYSGLGMATPRQALGIALSQPLLVPVGCARAVKCD